MNPAIPFEGVMPLIERLRGMRLLYPRAAVVAVAIIGCTGPSVPTTPDLPAPMVTVAPPVAKTVTRYEYFTGRAESPEKVEVRARVSGYLVKIYFQPGAEVKKGDPLFDIDPDIYQTELAMVEAEVIGAEARVARLTSEFKRLERLVKTAAATQEEFDKTAGDKLEAEAAIKGLKAKVAAAKLNLSYTKITAPISGLVGDHLVTEGNLIAGGQGTTTLLTTIVSVDPMDVSFDGDENTLQRLRQAMRDDTIKMAKPGEIPVDMGLAVHGAGYPLHGTVNFTNNQVDAKTGTIRVKARFANPKPAVGERLITTGMYARVRLPIGEPVPAMLVPDAAIGSDQGSKFLYVVGSDNKAVRLEATLGGQADGGRVVESVRAVGDEKPRALRPDERVIVSGLQRVRPGLTVDPKPAAKK
jgi:RND family efflux transporter MFP subunit